MMTDIEHFDPFEDELGHQAGSPEWLIVRAKKAEGFAWEDPTLYIARHCPILGFVSIEEDRLDQVTEFYITDITIDYGFLAS